MGGGGGDEMAMGQGGGDSKRPGGIHVEAETDGEWPEHGAGERYAPGAKPHLHSAKPQSHPMLPKRGTYRSEGTYFGRERL
jgi:hypothetical protein